MILSETPAGNDAGDNWRVAEYFSHPPVGPGGGEATDAAAFPHLPIEPEPALPWEPDFGKWLSVNDFGATADDGEDDTAAFQAAFDAAAERGATVVTIRGVGRGRGGKNWYNLKGDVTVPAPVREVLGLGFARVLGPGRFVVDEASAPAVRISNINSFGGTKPEFLLGAADRTLICDSCGGLYRAEAGRMFLSNCPGHVEIEAGAACWARHLNPEGDSAKVRAGALVANRGGTLWVMGTKSEGRGTRFLTADGGVTEVYGAYQYTNFGGANKDDRPLFVVESGGKLFAAGVKEVTFNQAGYKYKLTAPAGVVSGDTLEGRAWAHLVVDE